MEQTIQKQDDLELDSSTQPKQHTISQNKRGIALVADVGDAAAAPPPRAPTVQVEVQAAAATVPSTSTPTPTPKSMLKKAEQ